MNRHARTLLTFVPLLALAACAKTPERLAADVQAAIDKKDVNALLALADLEQSPAMARPAAPSMWVASRSI